ncbi:hypothetical protein D9Q98_007730 [Chlorella vulgaris]|uniref:Uncharacterized protein n=1 Tax=Chlorella vulgaris TaxID=3077 RepID=A0A9D4THJ8_CHLVU|nr:hypothetical protein D9Q98_007730 [Chlorella vulgaris]
MRDFRVRGYMQLTGLLNGPEACYNQALWACGQVGRMGLRASDDTLLLLPPATAWAMLNGTMVGCPEVFAAITSDSNGNNKQASGVFKEDRAAPALQPMTPFTVTPGSNANTLLVRTLALECFYEFKITEATGYFLGVEPVKWVSVFKRASAAGARALSPAAAAAASLAAAAALAFLLLD